MRLRHVITVLLIFIGGICLASQNPGGFLSPSSDENPLESGSIDCDAGYGQFNEMPGRFDRNADGRIDLIVTDRNVDSKGDYWATDRNFDGITDDYQYDRNFDGRIDQWEYDYDGDGIPDKIFVDADGDGRSEMYSEWNPVTRTYAWFGKSGNSGSPGTSSSGRSIRPKRRLAKGRAAYSE